jgi:methyl-accepting chemotaxis protein
MLPNTIRGKLLLVLVVALTGMLVVSVFALMSERSTILEDRKVKTRHLVEVAHGLLSYYEQQEKAGALAAEEARRAAVAAIKGLRYESKEYFWINDLGTPVPRMVMHATIPALDGKVLDAAKFNCATSLQDGSDGPITATDGKTNLFMAFNTVADRAGKGYVTYQWPKPKQGGGATEETFPKLSYVMKFAPWGWVIGSGIYIDDVDQIFRSRAATLGAISLAIAAAIGALLFLLVRGISGPIDGIKVAMKSIQETSDLSRRVAISGDSEIAAIGHSFNDLVASFQDLIRQVIKSADEVRALTTHLATGAAQVAAGSSEQKEASASMAAAMEETHASIAQVAANATDAHGIAEQAGELSGRGESIVHDAAAEMSKIAGAVQDSGRHIETLGEQSARISSIVSAIKEIADQTNLLALNAAIEAARAGEQGRGFAVVADEVRKLAERTTQQTAEITAMIDNIQGGTASAVQAMSEGSSRVQGGVELAREAGASMADIRSGAARVIEAVADITQALREQSAATQLVAGSVEKIVAMAEQNSSETGEIAATAEKLERLATDLHRTVERFHV